MGTDSRIYKTVDGGESWELQFTAEHPAAVRRTRSGGEHWNRIGRLLPPAQAGQAAFAASGTCVETLGTEHAWIATRAAATARILATTRRRGHLGILHDAIPQGTPASGIFTVALRDTRHGILAGGDLEAADALSDNVAISNDGGKTWKLVDGTPFSGPRPSG